MTPETTTALILSGDGYDITIAAEAYERRNAILDSSAAVAAVRNATESASATMVLTTLADLRIEVERCRKAVKEPVLAVGRRIDEAAKDFIGEVTLEEHRIRSLIATHAAEVARIRAEREAEERRAAQAAMRAKEEAARASDAAAASGRIADIVAARAAEAERQETLTARVEAADLTAEARDPKGVSWAWDFEMVEPLRLAAKAPHLVTIEPRRSDILRELKERAAASNGDHYAVTSWAELHGLRASLQPVVRKNFTSRA